MWQLMLACTPNTHASSLPPSVLPISALNSRAPASTAPPTTAATAAVGIEGCVSSLPSSRVCLVPPYEPRWPEGRAIRRSRLIAFLTPRGCSAAPAGAGDADRGERKDGEFTDAKEWDLPQSLVSLYRLQGAAALPPTEDLHEALLQQQRPTSAHPISPSSSPVGPALSPTDEPPVTPAASSASASAGTSAIYAAESSTGPNSSVERRYSLRRSRHTAIPTSQGPPKKRRGGPSGTSLRGGSRGPVAAAKIPAVRLPTEEEEAKLPSIPLQLADSFQPQHDKQLVIEDAKEAACCPCCGSGDCGSPQLLLAADWDLGSLVASVPPDIKPAKRYARMLQRASKQQLQEPASQRLTKAARLLLQHLYARTSCAYKSEHEEKGARVMAGAFVWEALRGLPIWTLHYLQDLLECM